MTPHDARPRRSRCSRPHFRFYRRRIHERFGILTCQGRRRRYHDTLRGAMRRASAGDAARFAHCSYHFLKDGWISFL